MSAVAATTDPTTTDPAATRPAAPSRTIDGHPHPHAGGQAPARDEAPVWTPRQPGRLTRAHVNRPWLGPVLVGSAVCLATGYTAWQDPNAGGIFPGCPLREATGWDCPGCGGLRATHALTRGDLAGALDHNVVVVVLLPTLVVLWGIWLLRSFGIRIPRPPPPKAPVWWALGALLLAFAVVRNIGGVAPFEYLNSTT